MELWTDGKCAAELCFFLSRQETPTKDLGDQFSGSCSQASEFCSPVPASSLLNRHTNSESSTDEEGTLPLFVYSSFS